jgi:hypothetical protein
MSTIGFRREESNEQDIGPEAGGGDIVAVTESWLPCWVVEDAGFTEMKICSPRRRRTSSSGIAERPEPPTRVAISVLVTQSGLDWSYLVVVEMETGHMGEAIPGVKLRGQESVPAGPSLICLRLSQPPSTGRPQFPQCRSPQPT